MADSDASLDIMIRLLVEEVGQERADKVMERYKEAAREGGKETEKFTLHGKEAHKMLHKLNEIVPGLGQAIKLAFDFSPMLAMAMAVGAVAQVVEHYKKEIEEAEKAKAALSVAVWEGQRRGAESAATEAARFHDAIAGAVTDQDKLKQKYEQQMAVLKAMITQHQQLIDVLEKEALAQAHGDKAQEETIKKRFADIRARNDVVEEEMQLQVKLAELAEQRRNKENAASEAAKAEAQFNKFETNPQAQADAAAATTWNTMHPLEELETKARSAGTIEENQRSVAAMKKSFGEGSPEMKGAMGMLDTSQKAWGDIDKFKANQALLDAQKKLEDELRSAAEKASGKLGELTKKISDLEAATGTAAKELGIHKHAAFAKQEGGTAAEMLTNAEEIAARAGSGQKVGEDEKELVRTVATVIQGKSLSYEASLRMLNAAHNNINAQQSLLNGLLVAMELMQEKSALKFKAFLERIKKLEAKAQPGV